MTKLKLSTAVSLAALAFAGAVQAGVPSGSTLGGVSLYNTGNNTVTSYTVATEITDPTTAAPISSATNGLVFNNTLTNSLVTASGSTNTYTVEFVITGGTFGTLTNGSLQAFNGTTGLTTTATVQNISPAGGTIARFLVTANDPAPAAVTITQFRLTGQVNVAAENDVSISGTVTQAVSGGGQVNVDTLAAARIIRFNQALGSYTAATNRNALAALPDFRLFGSAPNNTAAVTAVGGTNGRRVTVTGAYSVALNTGTFYSNLTGTQITTPANILSGASATVTGSNLNVLSPTLAGVAANAGATSGSASFTLATGTAATTGDFVLEVPATNGPVLQAGNYGLSITPTFAAGFAGPATASTVSPILNVTLAGTNIIAPWFSGSQAQSQSQVRLSNTGPTAANARVTITNGVFNFNGNRTNFPETACATPFSIPVDGELLLTNAVIFNCFGAFLSGDLLITVEAAGENITAKMRNTSANGTFETTLGRFSGSTVAGAVQ